MTSILSFVGLLADDVPPEHSDVPEFIMRGGRLMGTLNFVLGLVSEVREALRLLKPLAQRKGLSLGFRSVGATGPVFASIVNDFAGNAIKFTEVGSVWNGASRCCTGFRGAQSFFL